VNGFCAEFFAKSIGENRNHLAFNFGRYMKKTEGVVKILTFFGFCAAVFSSTAAPKNNLIVLK
jgi:hypothetical protein